MCIPHVKWKANNTLNAKKRTNVRVRKFWDVRCKRNKKRATLRMRENTPRNTRFRIKSFVFNVCRNGNDLIHDHKFQHSFVCMFSTRTNIFCYAFLGFAISGPKRKILTIIISALINRICENCWRSWEISNISVGYQIQIQSISPNLNRKRGKIISAQMRKFTCKFIWIRPPKNAQAWYD